MKNEKYFFGLILIAIGVIGIVDQLFNINLVIGFEFWPLFILIPGLCFEYAYFSRRQLPGLLVPGGILTTIGVLFIFETITRWRFSSITWGIYPLAVAIGLFQLYLFGGRKKELLVPVGILATVSVVSTGIMTLNRMFIWIRSSIVIPIIIILLGLYVITRKDRNINEIEE